MNFQVSQFINGVQVDQFQPKSNPLACFIGQTEDQLSTLLYPPYFRIFRPNQEPTYVQTPAYLKHLIKCGLELEKVEKIHAYSRSSSAGEETYIELKPLN